MLRAIAFLALIAFARGSLANGSDLPGEITLQAHAKVESGRVRLLVRVPLVLLASFSLPKRGPGYLDLEHIDDALKRVADATGRQVQITEDEVRVTPLMRAARLSLLSDRSFANFESALAHLEGPPLPVDTDLFWNQGFFDVELDYPLRSTTSVLTIRSNVAPELGRRARLEVSFVRADGSVRVFDLPGASEAVPLEPKWYEAAWRFVRSGFATAFTIDRLMFLLCLIAPFRGLRSAVAIAALVAALQAISLTAVAEGVVIDPRWLVPLANTCMAGAIVLLAIGNLAAPNFFRRWFIAAVVASLAGFELSGTLHELSPFAGDHTMLSTVSFDAGLCLGTIAGLVLVVIVRAMVAVALTLPLTVIVISALFGYIAAPWLSNASGDLWRAVPIMTWSSLAIVAVVLLPEISIAALLASFLPKHFAGAPTTTLLDVLTKYRAERQPGE